MVESEATVIMICGFFTKTDKLIEFRIEIAPALSMEPYFSGAIKRDIHSLSEQKCLSKAFCLALKLSFC
jgi:hypothetical protein